MTPKSDCEHCGTRKANGNCPSALDDGYAVQCVGSWAREKHDYTQRYVNATWATRRKFLAPRGAGGAAFVDLFAGPGRARIRETGEVIDGSPLVALAHERAPFSEVLMCDLDPENVEALKARTAARPNARVLDPIDSNEEIDNVVRQIPEYGLNLALVDPFRARDLQWATIERLAAFPRMDLIINFPSGDLKRNLENSSAPDYALVVDSVMPTGCDWRDGMRRSNRIATLVSHYRRGLVGLGYDETEVRDIPIKQGRGVLMYHLVFASKQSLGTKIWNSITTSESTGQRSLF